LMPEVFQRFFQLEVGPKMALQITPSPI